MGGENLQPIFNVQISPPRVVTPHLPPRTPEHQIFSSSSLISPTARSKSDDEETDNDFDTDNRDPRNLTFDGDVVIDDVDDDDDDQERVFLNDSDAFDNVYDNPVGFFF